MSQEFKYKTNPYYESNLLLLKPDCLKRGLASTIINKLIQRGYSISNIRIGKLNKKVIEELYFEVKEKYPDLYYGMMDYLLSGPVIIMQVHGEDVLTNAKNIIGNTMASDPIIKGSIRESRILPEDFQNYDKMYDYINLAHYPKPPKDSELPKTFEAKRDSEAVYSHLDSYDGEVEEVTETTTIKTPAKQYILKVLKGLRF
jgi:nucleoside-diphosphate kinase